MTLRQSWVEREKFYHGSAGHGLRSQCISSARADELVPNTILRVTRVHVDDLLGGDEVLDSTILEVMRELLRGMLRFKARQFTQMANFEIMVDMEHYKT